MVRLASIGSGCIALTLLAGCHQETNQETLDRLYKTYACHPGVRNPGDSGVIVIRDGKFHHDENPYTHTVKGTVYRWCKK
jgi:hypothetical protein